METKKVTKEMRDELRKPLPDAAVTKHPTKTYLSSIKAIYVFERLNDVFGIGSYTITSKEISFDKGAAVVKVRLQIPEYGIDLSSYGGNDNGGETNKNYDIGDAYKGAATDAVTKICSWLEIGIGVFKGMGNAPQPPAPLTADEQKAEKARQLQQQIDNIALIENLLDAIGPATSDDPKELNAIRGKYKKYDLETSNRAVDWLRQYKAKPQANAA